MRNRSSALKSSILKWLVTLALLDIAVVLLLLVPEMVDLTKLAAMRAGASLVLPVVVLILAAVLPNDIKATLIYWKLTNPLPGTEAFTKHGPADVRIDMSALAKNVGALPTEPREQNAKWYKLYRLVGDEPTVVEAHKAFLIFRDMAAMSLLLVPLVPAALWYAGVTPGRIWTAGALFLAQYVLCALCARHSGKRFVCNVLAIHCTKKVAGPK